MTRLLSFSACLSPDAAPLDGSYQEQEAENDNPQNNAIHFRPPFVRHGEMLPAARWETPAGSSNLPKKAEVKVWRRAKTGE